MKETAIDWLFEEMLKQGFFVGNKPLSYTTLDHIQQQAKAMEREQMIRFAENYEEYAYNKSENNRYVSPKTPDQYYNETYGGEQ